MIEMMKRQTAGYSDEPVPLKSYAALTAVLNVGVVGMLVANRKRLPASVPATDVALLALATHRISRVISRDKVTSWFRAPFTRLEKEGIAPSELDETPRGEGARKAIGELLGCPSCTGTWVAAGLMGAYVMAPRATRVVAALFAADAIASHLQMGYAAAAAAESKLEDSLEDEDDEEEDDEAPTPRVTRFDATTQL